MGMRPLGGVALLVAFCSLASAPLSAQLQTGRLLGTVLDQQHAAVPGATVTVTNLATNISARSRRDGEGNYVVTPLEPGIYRISAVAAGLSDDGPRSCRADGRPIRARGADARAGRALHRSRGHGEGAAAQHRVGDAEPRHHQRADRRPAAERPQLSRAREADAGRGAAAADRKRADRSAGDRERQRHRRHQRTADALPARRRRHHRRASGRHLDPDVGRRAAGVQRPAERLFRGVPRRRRHVQRRHEVGLERLPRQRVRVPAQRRVRREELLRRAEGKARAQSVRRHAGRSGRIPAEEAGPSSSPATKGSGAIRGTSSTWIVPTPRSAPATSAAARRSTTR